MILKKVFNTKNVLNDVSRKSDMLHILSDEEQRALKKCLLEMYSDISAVCERNNLTLIACGGTALGCVRHKGFIPWDDDLDLAMPREDCEKLKEIFDAELGEKYTLRSPNYKTGATNRFMKVYKKGTIMMGIGGVTKYDPGNIFVDIFPIDYVPENRISRAIKGTICNGMMFIASKVQVYETKTDKMLAYRSVTKESLRLYKVELAIGRLFSFFDFAKWADIIDNFLAKTSKSSLCSIATGRKHYFGEIKRWSDFFPAVDGDFEGKRMKIPGNVNRYLSDLYGDTYMQLPPENKRERHEVSVFIIPQEV